MEIYRQTAMNNLFQDGVFFILPRPNRDLTALLVKLREFLAEKLGAALDIQKGVTFWVAIQMKYYHPIKMVEKVFRPHLNTGKLRILHRMELEE